jgi:hypothetical protein
MTDEHELDRQAAFERLAQRTAFALERVLPAICPVLIPSRTGDPEVVGSAVLIRVGPSEFLVTAAHVMDIAQDQFYVGAEETIVGISGRFTATVAPNGNRNDDHLDLAVLPLAEHEVRDLRSCRFLSLDELEPLERPDHRPVVGSKYLLVGYPCSKQKIGADGILNVAPMRFVANARPAAEYCAPWVPQDHVMIEFDKKTSWGVGGKITPPDPYGVSGGGIFRVRGLLGGGRQSERLVAIPIVYTGKSGKSVIGTRISAVLSHIAAEYPMLARFVPHHCR